MEIWGKHHHTLERTHSMTLKEGGVFDCYNNVKLAARLTLKTTAPWRQHPVSILRRQVTRFVVEFIVITVG